MSAPDLVLAFETIEAYRPVGAMTVIVELPERAALALTGPAVRTTLAATDGSVPSERRRFRPFFVGFWLLGHRSGPIRDSRPLSW